MSTITALTVNYNTPDYLERLLVSFRKFYPTLPYLVIDGSDADMYERIKDFPERFGIELIHFSYNIHHGPGLTEGIKRITTDQILMVDSDIIVLNGGWLEMMEKELNKRHYGIGDIQQEACNKVAINYLHPALCLLNKDVVMQYPMPMKGGAPMLGAMSVIHNLKKHYILQNAMWLREDFHKHRGLYVQHNDNHDGMGTVARTGGYHLDTLGIVMATYKRPDGRTPEYLERTLSCIDKQTYADYHVFIVGDAYVNDDEIKTVMARHRNVTYFNLDRSPERERYGFGNMKMWCAGGVTAANKAIEMALAGGIEYICHIAHDDMWEVNHLETIYKIIKQHHPIFCCTLSTYIENTVLPRLPVNNKIVPFFPLDGGMIASTACVNYAQTRLRVMDRLHTEGIMSPCDAYLWEQLRNELKAKKTHGYVAQTVTCHHDEEGYAIRGK